MNDAELDALLAQHGAGWRDLHSESPAVDWHRVTSPPHRRRWLGALAIAIAAGIGAPTVDAMGNHDPASPTSPHASSTALPANPSDVLVGSPPRYFGLQGGGVRVVTTTYSELRRGKPPVVAIGGTRQGVTLYAVGPAASCQTSLDVTSYVSSDLLHGRGIAIAGQPLHLATIAGAPVAVPIAVSPSAGELAFVAAAHCDGPQQIVFVNLSDGSVIDRESLAGNRFQINSLAWSADGQLLAYRLEPRVYTDGYGPRGQGAFVASGTHVMEIHGVPHQLEINPRILPVVAPDGGGRYGPVFWWRGGWAAPFNGTLHRIDERGALGAEIATDFPNQVDSVSVDRTDAHLLIGSGPAAYRWDYSRLRPLPQHFSQPSW